MRSSEKIVRKNKVHLQKNRKFNNVSREVQKKIGFDEKFSYEKKEVQLCVRKKFIHTVSNFRIDSRIGSSPVVNEKFRKRCSSKEIHFKKIESSFSNPGEFTNFVIKKIRSG